MLLTTKFYPPPLRSDLIPREHLARKIGIPTPGGVTVIHGPAGYGKTTLARQWLQYFHQTYAWLSLDERDNDPLRFWRYVEGALAHSLRWPEPTSSDNRSTEERVCQLVEKMAPLTAPVILVIDDLHHVVDEQTLESFNWLLDHSPPALHTLVNTRSVSGLALPRRLVRGQAHEITPLQLRFAENEVAAFLARRFKSPPTPEQATQWYRYTSGWVAALQLATQENAGIPSTHGIPSTQCMPPQLLPYLTQEMLNQAPAAMRSFMLSAACFERFSAPMLADVLEYPLESVQQTLQALQHSALYIIPLDQANEWFRFHELFRDLLRSIAQQENYLVTPLHKRAADWFQQHGWEEDQLNQLLQAGEWHEAAQQVEVLGFSRMLAGKHESLAWWLAQMPPPVIAERPRLAIIKAWSLFGTEQVVTAHQFLDQAQTALAQPQWAAEYGTLAYHVFLLRAQLARFDDDLEAASHWALQAEQLLQTQAQPIPSVAGLVMGLSHYSEGELPVAEKQLITASRRAREENNTFCELGVSLALAQTLFQQGKTEQSLACLKSSRDWLLQQGQSATHIQRWQSIVYADIYRELDCLDEAQKAVDVLLEHAGDGVEQAHRAIILCVQAELMAARGDYRHVAPLLAEAEAILRHDKSHWSQLGPPVSVMRARMAWQAGYSHTAQQWLRDEGEALLAQYTPRTEQGRILACLLLARQGRTDEAGRHLQTVLQSTLQHQRLLQHVRALLAWSLIQHWRGRNEMAGDALKTAFTLAGQTGFRRLLLDDINALSELIPLLPGDALPDWWPRHETAVEPRLPFGETLTLRELEVLMLVAAGCSNQDIAHRLHIALTTAKAHVRNMFEKMGVNSRTQAIALARQLGLIT